MANSLRIVHIVPEFDTSGYFLTMTITDCKETSDFMYLGVNKPEMMPKVCDVFNSKIFPEDLLRGLHAM